MKRFFLFQCLRYFLCLSLFPALSVAFSVSPCAAETADSTQLPAYTQKIILEFNSPGAARQAVCEKLELPAGKTLALSARWDDTNGEHLLMTKTLAENGWKGTYFLNRCDENYAKNVVEPILKDGGSIGVHTLTHPHLETVSPNRMFYEILGNRVDLEVKTNQCVTTFTFPFGLGSKPDSLTSAREQGEALKRCGLLGGPETINMAERMELKPEEFISPYRFVADDSDPKLETFEKGFENGLNQLKAGKSVCGPYLALGTHSWQRRVHPDGFERLSKILATKANQPEIWHCNSNEYTAYRTNYVLKNAVKTTVDGSKVTLELLRCQPEFTGAQVPLGVKVTPCPTSATLLEGAPQGENLALEVTAAGEIMVPETRSLPVGIDRTDNDSNGSEKSESLQCTKIPGLFIGTRLDAQESVLRLYVRNATGKEMKNATAIVRCPLKYGLPETKTDWLAVNGLPQIASESLEEAFPLKAVSDEKYAVDAQFFDVQWDFELDGQKYRVHATTTVNP